MQKLKVGLIGTGYMGKCHALAWNAVGPTFGVPRPTLSFLGEITEELAKKKAEELGFEVYTGDWQKVVDSDEIDVVSITTPNEFHSEIAIRALNNGKHVWCEKPLSTSLEDTHKMVEAARNAKEKFGAVTAVGYNYIQNPMIRKIAEIINSRAIGYINHMRIEMDEDFMANPESPHLPRNTFVNGYGAIDDFGVHALSLLQPLIANITSVFCDMSKPYETRMKDGKELDVENYDKATLLLRLNYGAADAVIQLNRAAWGRKGRIFIQIFGSEGSILYDQERLNEIQIYQNHGDTSTQGFKTIIAGPTHKPYGNFIPAPGHSLGFNDLKVIECHELMKAINNEPSNVIDFAAGFEIEKVVDKAIESFESGKWVR